MTRGPRRIVCLSTETVDTLYRLGQQSRIVGISGFTVHPPQARREKPRVGGEDVFADLAQAPAAAGRILPSADEVAARAPELIIGSWCGKKFRPERVAERPGWTALPAVVAGRLHEIKSADILQPGIIALTRGADQLAALIQQEPT